VLRPVTGGWVYNPYMELITGVLLEKPGVMSIEQIRSHWLYTCLPGYFLK
jgi:hypothetical protein